MRESNSKFEISTGTIAIFPFKLKHFGKTPYLIFGEKENENLYKVVHFMSGTYDYESIYDLRNKDKHIDANLMKLASVEEILSLIDILEKNTPSSNIIRKFIEEQKLEQSIGLDKKYVCNEVLSDTLYLMRENMRFEYYLNRLKSRVPKQTLC